MGVTKFAFISTFCANISAITSCWADGGQLFFLFCFFYIWAILLTKVCKLLPRGPTTCTSWIMDPSCVDQKAYGSVHCVGNFLQTAAWSFSSNNLASFWFWLPVNVPLCQNWAYFCCLSQPPLYMSHCFLLWLSQNQWNVNATLHVLHTTMTWSHHFFRSKATCLTEGKQNIYFGHYSLTHIYSPVNNSSFFVFFFLSLFFAMFFSHYIWQGGPWKSCNYQKSALSYKRLT